MTARTIIPAALALLALSGCAHRATSDVIRVATAWCSAIVQHDDDAAERLMTQSLRVEVARMRAVDSVFRNEHSGDKPPLGDGLRLTSFPDAIATCKALDVDGDTVLIRITPAGSPDGTWEDRLKIRSVGNLMQVDDVEFGAIGSDRLRVWLAAGGM